MRRSSRQFWIVLPLAAAGALALSVRPSPLPPYALPEFGWPPVSAPASMSIHHLPTGSVRRSAAMAYRGGSLFDRREFIVSAVLVRHPNGDMLIDAGFGRNIDRQFQQMPFWFRSVTRYARGPSAAEQLDRAGYDRARLRGIVLTHAHWDHASGLTDFPSTPVWINARERAFVRQETFHAEVARRVERVRYEVYAFESGPYLAFDASHDVHGDGSVVIVPVPGHTPGSVSVFVSLPAGERYVFVGDVAWQLEGIVEREERPWFTRWPADSDAASVRTQLRKFSAIASRFPELIVVPAHDARAYATLPRLRPAATHPSEQATDSAAVSPVGEARVRDRLGSEGGGN